MVVDGGNAAAANISSYEIRLEYVCMSANGCNRTVQLRECLCVWFGALRGFGSWLPLSSARAIVT